MAKEKKSKIKIEGKGLQALSELLEYLKGASDKPLTLQIVDPDAEEPITFTWEPDQDKIKKLDVKLPKEVTDKKEDEPEDKSKNEPEDEPEDKPVDMEDEELIIPDNEEQAPNEEQQKMMEAIEQKNKAMLESCCHVADELI